MQVSPFFHAIGEAMPRILGVQSYITSVVAIYMISCNLEIVARHAGQRTKIPKETPLPRAVSRTDYTKATKHLRWELKANLSNIVGATAFLYFSAPYGLIIGYTLWSIHYIAKIQSKELSRESPHAERAWVILYGFGFITSIACALFAHGGIPITVAVIVARTAATLLSSTETTLLFYKAVTWTTSIRKKSIETPMKFVRPVTNTLFSDEGALGRLATTIASTAQNSVAFMEKVTHIFLRFTSTQPEPRAGWDTPPPAPNFG